MYTDKATQENNTEVFSGGLGTAGPVFFQFFWQLHRKGSLQEVQMKIIKRHCRRFEELLTSARASHETDRYLGKKSASWQ